ncbi:protein of unknown function UPF0153 [Thermovirga lienii DSM 17291]|uniref:Fe-S oxidoreductase n=1 Tax=Thermovirga lienii (strain ATCC BAA-1197 / DSM 17291 / Cas60314) TaxID=580340 RepID=G7V948_THELD|nr:YkgJ family cysteine cluster protein [Thermovirga lienii]AER66417.1 protein of unknown function UPF0153 [Thermovirga lienii DSM 17291]MDN5318942.1 uncharacterized protein [Thermovirga sp.]MDN5368484.1 uncharacterized protein [Thermovirga sp.]
MKNLISERWWSGGLRFSCLGCGRCCRGEPGCVWITPEEVKKLAEFLSLTETKFLSKYTYSVDGRVSLREKQNGECVFYDSDTNKCSIYEYRPLQCRLFPFWPSLMKNKENWEWEKRRCPGIGEGELHSAQEIQQCLNEAPFEDL